MKLPQLKTVDASPRASSLIEGMRDFGYQLETAMADIVDNSITAQASTIRISTEIFAESPSIAFFDDGFGMTEGELFEALRPGSRNPRDKRDQEDLGRFGLGLKTASFSQCRRLTVISKHDGVMAAARWDLDQVAATDQWLLEIPGESEIRDFARQIGKNGTVVVWEKLDRLVDEGSSEAARHAANHALSSAISHLSLVFHRFLKGETGTRKITIRVNGDDLESRDPFCTGNPATIPSPVEDVLISGERIRIQAFTLPHHSKVTPRAWEEAAGPEGYLRNQGFYVYRSGRLIIHGTWFGLARQIELTKLCRVRIDLPNSLDAEWKIDVKKSSAQPPRVVRERLRNLVDRLGATSRRVYQTRGTRLTDDNPMPVWVRKQKDGKITFALNREHPVLTQLRVGDGKRDVESMISLVEASLPLDALLADLGGTPEAVQVEPIENDDLEAAFHEVLRTLLAANAPREAIDTVFEIAEPFRSNPDATQKLIAAIDFSDD